MKAFSALKAKHILWAAVPVVAVILLISVSHSGAKTALTAPPPPVVEVAPVEQRSVPIYGEYIGTLTGFVNATIKAQVTGYLRKQSYKEGSYVRKGQLLFQIDPQPFQAALDQAQGRLAQAKSQLLVDQAQVATAIANQLESQLDVNRYTPLAKAEAVSQQDLDDAVQSNRANQARVQAAKAAIASAKAQIESAQAEVETARINLNFTRIVSPIDGIAGIAEAQVGDLVSTTSGPLTTVSTLNPIKDYFTMSEQAYLEAARQYAYNVGPSSEKTGRTTGRPTRLELILSDGSVYPYPGTFYFADRAVDPNTGTIRIAGLFPNPGNVLRPGQYGKVRSVIRVEKNALLIPQAAVNELQGSTLVDVVGPGNRVAIRPVKLGDRVGAGWIVLSGVKLGDRVIVEGQQMLGPGMPVNPKPFKAGNS
jgi:RND family efflux transporter MFP subunit